MRYFKWSARYLVDDDDSIWRLNPDGTMSFRSVHTYWIPSGFKSLEDFLGPDMQDIRLGTVVEVSNVGAPLPSN